MINKLDEIDKILLSMGYEYVPKTDEEREEKTKQDYPDLRNFKR